jgi:DNA-binding transcriptional LysR family regulator
MDKLRALQYFAAAAEERSMSAAARRLGVSTPAIAKLLTALERSLGTILFDRTVRGLALTADGESYLEACQPALAQLAAADEVIAGSATRHRGTVVVGTPPFLGQHCILPALSRFHARYPDIQIEIRVVHQLTEDLASAVDVFVLTGWQEDADLCGGTWRRIDSSCAHARLLPRTASPTAERPRSAMCACCGETMAWSTISGTSSGRARRNPRRLQVGL